MSGSWDRTRGNNSSVNADYKENRTRIKKKHDRAQTQRNVKSCDCFFGSVGKKDKEFHL